MGAVGQLMKGLTGSDYCWKPEIEEGTTETACIRENAFQWKWGREEQIGTTLIGSKVLDGEVCMVLSLESCPWAGHGS